MDWQTKEDIDSQFSELSDKLDSIMRHFKIEDETLEDDSDEPETDEEDSEELNI